MKPILIDTSLWISHFKGQTDIVSKLLQSRIVFIHEFIIGELSLGQFKPSQRGKIFALLTALHRTPLSAHEEIIEFVYQNQISGMGIGWIDTHLLHSCFQHGLELHTNDKKLITAANMILR